MEPQSQTTAAVAQEIATRLVSEAQVFATSLLRPWNGYQIVIALILMVVAHLAARFLAPRYHHWLRDRDGWPKWRLRYALMLHKRLRLTLFVAMIWPLIWVMREVTWPSRSYLLGIVGSLALAWLLIALATRLIVNDIARALIRLGGWIWVTLVILGLTDETQRLFQSIGFDFGDTRLTLWTTLQAMVLLTALFAMARFLAHASAANISRVEDISPSMRVLVVKFLQLLLYGMALFVGLHSVGVDLTGLAVLSGAIGVGLGFGLQKVVSNLVSGIIILLDKSVKPGDVISLGETFGWINALGARYVSVVTRDGKEYLIPNEDLITGQVVNWSHSNDFVRLDIYFGTAYGDDPHLVRRIAIEAAQGVDRVLTQKPPVCHIVGFGDSSVDYILRFWITDPTGGLTNIRGNVYLALWDAFRAHGVSIPFPQREVRMLGTGQDIPTEGQAPAPATAPPTAPKG
ncbi:mechanosensitive ion channel family protein [Pseudooceanicola aestuarii]|uniref:mechanosensitive ion channel family protein n=1 Tax=Pseudooceanicola aestuarii TaxID=2697319 RepID=UPI0013D4B5B5|nr:mechanosensitive ion channel domain-containing protein [Pseudooceanicola aestuarii]